MKIRWIAAAMFFCVTPALAQNTAGVIAHQDGNNTFLTSQDVLFRGSVAQPIRPTIAEGTTSGGGCLSTRNYIFFVTYENATGETQLSPPSYEFRPASGVTNRISVVRDVIGWNVNTWTAWYASSVDNYQTIRGCSTAGAITDTAAETTSVLCVCGTSQLPTVPTSNTTADIYPLRVFSEPSAIGATIGVDATFSDTATFSSTTTFDGLATYTAGATISSGTFTLDTTGSGTGSLHLSGGIGATAGARINLEGVAGDSYLLRDADTGFVFVYKDGVLRATITGSGVIPGRCPTDVYSMEVGTQCLSSDGDTVIATPGGPFRF